MSTTSKTLNENLGPANRDIDKLQRLRIRRFSMALATYAVVVLATIIISGLGLGEMSGRNWSIFIAMGVFGNGMFYYLFSSGNNLRFKDPSLTKEQIIFSSLWGAVALHSLPEARPIVLMFYLPAFSFGMLRLTRKEYLRVVLYVSSPYAALLCFEYLQRGQEFKVQYELFLFSIFGILLTWFAFFGGFISDIRRRLQVQKEEIQQAHDKIQIEMTSRQQAEIEKDSLIKELKDALNNVKTLSGMLPICASCKKIRDDKGYWNQIESYIKNHSEAEFSHGICPECRKKLYPDIEIEDEESKS